MAFFKSPPTPPVSRVDDRILPRDRAGEIERRRPDRKPNGGEPARLAQAMRGAGGMDQGFRGDAADIEARSAEPVGLDEDRVEAELAGADRGDIAARAAADDENLAAKLVHGVLCSCVIASACEAILGRSALRPRRCAPRKDGRLFMRPR